MAPADTTGSFEDAEQRHRREMAKLTPGQRVNRALELTELARSLATAKRRPRKSAEKKQ